MRLLRVYLDPHEIGLDGYPFAWHKGYPAIKDLVRALASHRCVRCSHPFVVGETPGEWSPCDEECTHGEPTRPVVIRHYSGSGDVVDHLEAQWRILTVHHLNGIKHDCRWWNLAALCQRCHLTIQAKVYMERPWTREHSEWFRPYVAGFYAWRFLGIELDREQVQERIDELLELEHRQLQICEED